MDISTHGFVGGCHVLPYFGTEDTFPEYCMAWDDIFWVFVVDSIHLFALLHKEDGGHADDGDGDDDVGDGADADVLNQLYGGFA